MKVLQLHFALRVTLSLYANLFIAIDLCNLRPRLGLNLRLDPRPRRISYLDWESHAANPAAQDVDLRRRFEVKARRWLGNTDQQSDSADRAPCQIQNQLTIYRNLELQARPLFDRDFVDRVHRHGRIRKLYTLQSGFRGSSRAVDHSSRG